MGYKEKASNEQMLGEIKHGLYVMMGKRSKDIKDNDKLESMKSLANIIMKEGETSSKDDPKVMARVIDDLRIAETNLKSLIREKALRGKAGVDSIQTSVVGDDTDSNAGKNPAMQKQNKTDIHE